MDRRVLRWASAGAVALGAMVLLAGAGIAQTRPEIVIRGRVKDQAGNPLADYPVRLLKTKTILNLLHFSTGSQQQEEARTQTDASGNFQLKVVPDPKYDYFYLRFYDAKTFDPVRYSVPGDKDITRDLKTRPELQVDEVIGDHPDWPRVQAMLGEFGSDSNRGRILRSLGLPERRETVAGAPGRENWWYYAKGLCYQLQSDEVLKVRRFDPVLPPRPAT
jgi:hypothetical protein